jgi:alkylated DNA repair dioxygenase AlkB
MFIDPQLHEENKFPEAVWGKTAHWPASLLQVRARLEAKFNRKFQVCVCIYYPNGQSGVDFHSDYIAFGDTNLIPSLSLGEERSFLLREKSSQEVYEILLEEGSLLLMGDRCQEDYEHSLPTDSRYRNGRINLTFRPYGFGEK